MSGMLISEKKDRVLTLTINLPERMNALHLELWEEIYHALEAFRDDEDSWVLILMEMEDLPSSQKTRPSVVFKPHAQKKRLVPYDTKRAPELLAKRENLPRVLNSPDDVLEVPDGIVSRNKLVIKHDSEESLMHFTRSDEG